MSSAFTLIEIFCSYTPKDERMLLELEVHLTPLKRQGLITIQHDLKILTGTDKTEAIDTQQQQASVILLLISPDFLASDYCYQTQMQRAVQRHEQNQVRVIPILVRPCDYSHTPFAQLQCLPRNGKPITTWENRDLAWQDVATGIRQTIEDLPPLPPHIQLPAIWDIPYPRNPFFIGRDDLLSRLHTQLQAGQVTAISQPAQAISGLGGIGKTQAAVEYAYRYHQEYKVVLWARAENQETLIASYNTIATLLNLPERGALEQEITIGAVKRWLQTHREWLLILDNADDLALVPPFLPPALGGHLLLTTRAQAMGRLAQRIEVETLSDEQGALLLLRRAALIAPDTTLAQVSSEDRQLAIQITQELGGLPLALDQAGAYLEETGDSLAEYQQLYHHRRTVLLIDRRGLVSDHPEPVATTWSLSFQRVEEKNAAAADLLRLCAFLAPDAIPKNIITKGASHLGPRLAAVAADPFLLSQAIEALRAYSLIQRDPRTQTLSAHRLVQAILYDSMASADRKEWQQRVVQAVKASSPDVEDVAQWDTCELWLPHAQVCAIWIEQQDMKLAEAADLLNDAGHYLSQRGRYDEAEPFHVRALSICEELSGTDHPNTAISLTHLAHLYWNQGKFTEAEPLFLRALQINEQQLGADHRETAGNLNNLAVLYWNQNKYAEAEPLLLRALTIGERYLGIDHPDTANNLNALALLYESQGKYAEAEPLYLRALQINQQKFGDDHPLTAINLNNLALLYHHQGKYAEAEPLYLRALQIGEQKLGANHPDTAKRLNNLALLYKTQGKLAEAEPLYLRALAIVKQQFGPQHADTKTIQKNYAALLRAMGRDEEVASLETDEVPPS